MFPTPTYVVGVGGAGISILSALSDLVTTDTHCEQFGFAAVDSDPEALAAAPDSAAQVRLRPDGDFLTEDVATHPYLTREMSVPPAGAARQRPVGRYTLDGTSRSPRAFDALSSSIVGHAVD